MNPALIQVFAVFGFVSAFFFYLAYKLLSRKRTRLSYTCSLFYIFSAFGLLINIVQRVIDKHNANIILNPLVLIVGMIGLAFLLLFNLMLSKSGEVITIQKEIIVVIIWSIVLFSLMAIPGGVEFTYEIDANGTIQEGQAGYDSRYDNDLGTPKWSLGFAIYAIIVVQVMMLLILYTAQELRKKMGDTKFAKKYSNFIYGVLLFDILPIGNAIANVVNTDQARTIFLFFQLLIIPASWLIYVGLRQED